MFSKYKWHGSQYGTGIPLSTIILTQFSKVFEC